MKTTKILVYLLAAAVTLLLLAGCGRGAETAAGSAAAPTPELASCQLVNGRTAQCGSITVPENYEQADGRQIDIHYTVIPADSSQPQPDPVFMLAGGPGQAAIETFPFLLGALDDLNQSRNIVLVDQRGTGQSAPLACPQLGELPLDTTEAEVLATVDDCRRELDDEADLTQYITPIAMRDLDAVREELGYEQINLIGVSYGTRAAQVYMHLYPERVRTAVFDAVTSPELVLQLQAPADGQRALDLLFARCVADEACAAAFPDFEEDFWEITAALGDGREITLTHPISGERETLTVSGDDLLQSVFNLLYSSDLVSLLPLLVTETAETGNYGPLLAQIISFTANVRSYQGMFYAVACSEDATQMTLEEAAAARGNSRFPLVAEQFLDVCADWPRTTDVSIVREPLNSDIPTLLLSGSADPITPPAYADDVAAYLTNSLHIVLPDYGHGVLTIGCMPAIVTDFIRTGAVAGLDTGCTAEIVPPPFFVSPAGPQP